jgi:hypothetical protein
VCEVIGTSSIRLIRVTQDQLLNLPGPHFVSMIMDKTRSSGNI